jgi:hypothetical protein
MVPPNSGVKGGLCSTCDNAPTCSYLRSRRYPVLQCEEFTAFTPPDVRTRPPSRPRPEADTPHMSPVRPNHLLGLCSTCEEWETCTYSRFEGGVWQCEEYH